MNNALAQAIADVAVGLACELRENLVILVVGIEYGAPTLLAVLREKPPEGIREVCNRLRRDVVDPVVQRTGFLWDLWCVVESEYNA